MRDTPTKVARCPNKTQSQSAMRNTHVYVRQNVNPQNSYFSRTMLHLVATATTIVLPSSSMIRALRPVRIIGRSRARIAERIWGGRAGVASRLAVSIWLVARMSLRCGSVLTAAEGAFA